MRDAAPGGRRRRTRARSRWSGRAPCPRSSKALGAAGDVTLALSHRRRQRAHRLRGRRPAHHVPAPRRRVPEGPRAVPGGVARPDAVVETAGARRGGPARRPGRRAQHPGAAQLHRRRVTLEAGAGRGRTGVRGRRVRRCTARTCRSRSTRTSCSTASAPSARAFARLSFTRAAEAGGHLRAGRGRGRRRRQLPLPAHAGASGRLTPLVSGRRGADPPRGPAHDQGSGRLSSRTGGARRVRHQPFARPAPGRLSPAGQGRRSPCTSDSSVSARWAATCATRLRSAGHRGHRLRPQPRHQRRRHACRSWSRALPAPRVVWVMVPAGDPTDATVAELGELLAAGDLVIDGGNSRFTDDVEQRRAARVPRASATSTAASPAVSGVWRTATA